MYIYDISVFNYSFYILLSFYFNNNFGHTQAVIRSIVLNDYIYFYLYIFLSIYLSIICIVLIYCLFLFLYLLNLSKHIYMNSIYKDILFFIHQSRIFWINMFLVINSNIYPSLPFYLNMLINGYINIYILTHIKMYINVWIDNKIHNHSITLGW